MTRSLSDRVLDGDRRAAGRLMRLVDDGDAAGLSALEDLHSHTGNAYMLGLTGNPGSGKSTLSDRLIQNLRSRGETVAVVAIDPTSPFSGGAILGDRVRMGRHSSDDGVFIRSVATRGNLGGISRSTPAIVQIFDAMGFDWIIVETVGVGQDEVDVAAFSDTCIVVTVPGLGDEIQTAKAGLLEVADVFVVNKSDRPGADRVERDLNQMLDLDERAQGEWRPPVVPTVATDGTGLDELLRAIEEHRRETSDDAERRRRRMRYTTRLIAVGEVTRQVDEWLASPRWPEVRARIEDGSLSPFGAATTLLRELDVTPVSGS